MRNPIFLILTGVILMLGACSQTIDDYTGTTPSMQFDRFFNGPLKGTAIVQDRSGKVIKSFTVDMLGQWKGNEGSLQEHFVYNDGKLQDRVWKITKQSDNSFIGTAPDIIGEAIGQSNGRAILWNYIMQVDVDDKKWNFSFDDWMYAMNDNLVINRSMMKKFGLKVGEITIMIEKQPAK